jgi:hypothetical protein
MPTARKMTLEDRARTEALRACMTAAWRLSGTHAELARLTGVPPRTISRICGGKNQASWLDAHKVWQGLRRKVGQGLRRKAGQIPPLEDLVESLAAMKPLEQVEPELHFLAMVTEAIRRVLHAGRTSEAVP